MGKPLYLSYVMIKKLKLTSWTTDDTCDDSPTMISVACFSPVNKVDTETMETNGEEVTIDQQLDQPE